jgi:hypothetical protein
VLPKRINSLTADNQPRRIGNIDNVLFRRPDREIDEVVVDGRFATKPNDSPRWEDRLLHYKPIRSFPQFDFDCIHVLSFCTQPTTVTLLHARKHVYATDRTSCATETTATTRKHRSSNRCRNVLYARLSMRPRDPSECSRYRAISS